MTYNHCFIILTWIIVPTLNLNHHNCTTKPTTNFVTCCTKDFPDCNMTTESPKCQEPAGYQFRASIYTMKSEADDTFYEELTEPLNLLNLPGTKKLSEHGISKNLILINLKLVNREKTVNGVSYIVIDHVYDENDGKVHKLLKSIVFKVKQEQINLVYGMSFLKIVNAFPQEEVINKDRDGFKGCYTETKQPTCGQLFIGNITVPFSEGFCCSCDSNVNREREMKLAHLFSTSGKNKYYNISIDSKYNQLNLKYLPIENDPDDFTENRMKCSNKHFLLKRTITKQGNQVRGGQSCIDRAQPPGSDPIAYHESAHCLRFSKMWYNTYRIHEPLIEHTIAFQMYKKRHPERCSSNWIELTRGSPSILGTEYRTLTIQKYGLMFSYNDKGNLVKDEYLLKGQNYLLKPKLTKETRNLPFAQGGAKEYLLLDQKLFDFDGDTCDKIGVSFLAFAKQKNRCGIPKGSCLCNQPYLLWLEDRKRKKQGLKGKYYLENFAILPDKEKDRKNEYDEESLHLEYHGEYIAKVSVSVDNFVNNVISTKTYGILSEIYIDAANEYSTTFIINVINDGLLESTYRVALADLPDPMPKIWKAKPSKNFTIAPHNSYSLKLQTYGKLPLERFHCIVELLAEQGDELIASRRITVQNNDRCYCLWECQCACEGSILGLKCEVLDQVSFNKAGYQGSPPPRRPNRLPRRRREPLIDKYHKAFTTLVFFVILSCGLLILGIINAFVRVLLFCLIYCTRSRNNKPVWKEFNFTLLDSALIPLFVCCNKDKLSNNIYLNIFHFFLIIPALICFFIHLILIKKEIFGGKGRIREKLEERSRRNREECKHNSEEEELLISDSCSDSETDST